MNSYFFAITSMTWTPSVALGDTFAGLVLLGRESVAAKSSETNNRDLIVVPQHHSNYKCAYP